MELVGSLPGTEQKGIRAHPSFHFCKETGLEEFIPGARNTLPHQLGSEGPQDWFSQCLPQSAVLGPDRLSPCAKAMHRVTEARWGSGLHGQARYLFGVAHPHCWIDSFAFWLVPGELSAWPCPGLQPLLPLLLLGLVGLRGRGGGRAEAACQKPSPGRLLMRTIPASAAALSGEKQRYCQGL